MKNIYTNPNDLPSFTPLGFMKTKVPLDIWEFITDMYNVLKQLPPIEESFENLHIKYKGKSQSELFEIRNLHSVAVHIHKELKGIHEWWCKHPLEPSAMWGIRSYKKGSSMDNHRDWINTHHVSSIIVVDKDLNGGNDWPLHFQSHDGNWHKIYAEPGDMILYESAKCEHGRPEIFGGNYFRNLFIHYSLKEWQYLPIE